MAEDKGATPPNGGRMDHDAMRRASELPVTGAAATDTVAASGGLELPGRVTDAATVEERIPGERDPGTFAPSDPGIIAGTGYGENIPPGQPDTMDERTHGEHAREGGGDPGQRSKGRGQR